MIGAISRLKSDSEHPTALVSAPNHRPFPPPPWKQPFRAHRCRRDTSSSQPNRRPQPPESWWRGLVFAAPGRDRAEACREPELGHVILDSPLVFIGIGINQVERHMSPAELLSDAAQLRCILIGSRAVGAREQKNLHVSGPKPSPRRAGKARGFSLFQCTTIARLAVAHRQAWI